MTSFDHRQSAIDHYKAQGMTDEAANDAVEGFGGRQEVNEPINFPRRLGVDTPRVQFETLKKMTSRELLSALVTKYPQCTFTADELFAAIGHSVEVRAVADNEWQIVPCIPEEGDR